MIDEANSMALWKLEPVSLTDPVSQTFLHGDATKLGEGLAHVYFTAAAGVTFRLFDNPHLQKKLHLLGLRPEMAHGCAMRFLMQPTAEVQQMFAQETALLNDEGALRIGIQIRFGDQGMFGAEEELGIEAFQPWFDCAQQVDKERQLGPEQLVIWYVVADSSRARQLAKQVYWDKVKALVGLPKNIRILSF